MSTEEMKRKEALAQLLAEDETIDEVKDDKKSDDDEEGDVEDKDTEDKPVEESSYEEYLAGMFEGTDLSEEAQDKIRVLFEAAVNYKADQKVIEIKSTLDEEYESALEESKADLQTQADGYLSYVVEDWVEKNKPAVQNVAKMQIMESFISGLRELFLEHDIDVPEASESVIDELMVKVDSLEEDVKKLAVRNTSLFEELEYANREIALKDLSEGLTTLEAVKLKEIVESKEFDSLEDYTKGVKMIKESFVKSNVSEEAEDEVITESEEAEVPESIKFYSEMITKSKRK